MSQEERQVIQEYRQLKRQSLISESEVNSFNTLNAGAQTSPLSREDRLFEMLANSGGSREGGSAPSGMGMQEDFNSQQQKLNFLTSEGGGRTPQDYSSRTRQPPLSPMEVKAGTVIPGLLLVGINSDLPGAVVGQVSENVYDTATGRFLLIPQGTRIIGVYDSRITHGQSRVAIVWNRLIYPDGSSLNIAGSPGTDMAGYSGIRGRVNNHYGRLITAALFSSVFVAAAEIAAPNRGNNNNPSPSDVLAETTGMTIANLGARMADRALNIQPTITVRPGHRFNVMVMQDVVFTYAWNSAGQTSPLSPRSSGGGTRVVGF